MSATLEPDWLETVDFRGKFSGEALRLEEADYDPNLALHKRMTAKKTLAALGVSASKDMKAAAKRITENHIRGTRTLVVLNTVDRAKAVYSELEKLRKKSATPALMLVHSRFRPQEREEINAQIQEASEVTCDRIIVATQVVEAGVDISSRTLVTELAPWASIVQRIGRCNRTGDDGPGRVFWIDVDEKMSLPYSAAHLAFAREHAIALDGKSVSPKSLDDYKRQNESPGSPFFPFEHTHVLRRRDLIGLADTSPDLSGNDVTFVRSDDPETDIQVFWRDVAAGGPGAHEPVAHRRELCNVPIGQAREFLDELIQKKRMSAFVWDHLDDRWAKLHPRQIRPGLMILMPAAAGGYSRLGWDRDSTAAVAPISTQATRCEEGTASDPNSSIPVAISILEHTQHVRYELTQLIGELGEWGEDWSARIAHILRARSRIDPDHGSLGSAAGRRPYRNSGDGQDCVEVTEHKNRSGESSARQRRWWNFAGGRYNAPPSAKTMGDDSAKFLGDRPKRRRGMLFKLNTFPAAFAGIGQKGDGVRPAGIKQQK